ncbi:MAG: hypothetical protein K8I00_03205, partial [Candidatus Omnitrophica bacterium]|nr:hypothetical protein [Candidatus Omnitrophota bacterium]
VKNDISLSPDYHYDALILGDSYNLTALNPQRVAAGTDFSVFNFSAFAVNSVITSYVLLKNNLEKEGPKPKWLVIGYLDYIPQMSREEIRTKYAHTLFDFKKGNVGVFAAEFGLTMGLKFLIPSLKHQGYFLLMAKPTPLEKIKFVEQSVYERRGYYEWHPDRVFDGNIDYIHTDDEFYVTPYFDKYLRKILTLAAEHDVRVLYLMPTVVPSLDARLTAAGRRQAYMAYLNGLQTEFPLMEISYPALELSDPQLYTDQDHLNRQGSEILCQLVRDWLGTRLKKQ